MSFAQNHKIASAAIEGIDTAEAVFDTMAYAALIASMKRDGLQTVSLDYLSMLTMNCAQRAGASLEEIRELGVI